jgi:hypothetical protein
MRTGMLTSESLRKPFQVGLIVALPPAPSLEGTLVMCQRREPGLGAMKKCAKLELMLGSMAQYLRLLRLVSGNPCTLP